jgi:outer membrane receptor for ferrienterochelin and colicins
MAMKRTLIPFLLLLALSARVFGGGGSISGRVTSRTEGTTETLVGATVLVQGTVRGTTTNLKGEYLIPDVPAGTHTVTISMVGYERVSRTGVVVEEGKVTVLNVSHVQTPVQIEQYVITASKRKQSLEDVPVSMSVMDAGEIQQRNALVIDDALRYIPGVNMTGFQVNIRGSSGYSRGAGSRVLMLVDGIPFIAGDTGELSFESIPVGQVERIEVVKGASSALYGSSALGGVINIITKPIPERPETIVRLYGGMYNDPSYDQWKWSDHHRFTNGQSVSYAYKSGNLGISLFMGRQLDDGYRENDYRRRYNFYIKATQDLSKSSALTLTFNLLNQFGGQFLYWRTLDSALVPPIAQQTDNVKSVRFFVSGQYNSVMSDKLLFTSRVMWLHNDWGFETRAGIGRAESYADGLRAEALATLLLDNIHTLTFGVDGNVDMVGGDLFSNRLIGGLAVYGQDEMKLLEDFTLILGARFDFQSLGLTEPSGQINPKAAIVYRPFVGTTLRASYGQGFRVPSVAEAFITAGVNNLTAVPNSDLKPEQSYSYEVGVSQAVGNFGSFDAAAFRTDYDNLIEAGLIVSGTDLQIQWRNVIKARVQGVETSFKTWLFDGGLSFNLGYTYVYPEDITNDDILRYRPRHLFYTNLTTRIGPVTAGADFRYISRVDRIDDELVEVGIVPDGDERVPIYVTDFRIGADFGFAGVPLNATFNMTNALQYNYVELIGNMMPPRNYVLVLEARF